MPMLSLDGKFAKTLYICLQEAEGKFGPRVVSSMYKAPNLYVDCSKSGKMGIKEAEHWFANCYFPNVADKTTSLLDSCGVWKDAFIERVTPEGKSIEV